MLRRTLAAYPAFIFLGLLSSVTGDEGFPGNNLGYDSLPCFLSTVREKCLDYFDPPSCRYWDTLQDAVANSEFKQAIELTPDNKTTWKISENSQEVEIPGNPMQKRFTVYRRKSPIAGGYKRGPGFRSWGGKRDSVLLENPDKRSKFASWGGKRDGELPIDDIISESVPEKRPKFQNWGGKKSTDDFLEELGKYDKRGAIWKDRVYYLSEPFKKHVPKRPQFQSWGGKRASYPWHDYYEYFHPQARFIAGEKRKFSSWGGKRYDDNQDGGFSWGENGNEVLKRYVFQNWGGKRAEGFDSKKADSSEKTKQGDKGDVGGMLETSNLNPRGEEGESRR